jgi:hypothetical protein
MCGTVVLHLKRALAAPRQNEVAKMVPRGGVEIDFPVSEGYRRLEVGSTRHQPNATRV